MKYVLYLYISWITPVCWLHDFNTWLLKSKLGFYLEIVVYIFKVLGCCLGSAWDFDAYSFGAISNAPGEFLNGNDVDFFKYSKSVVVFSDSDKAAILENLEDTGNKGILENSDDTDNVDILKNPDNTGSGCILENPDDNVSYATSFDWSDDESLETRVERANYLHYFDGEFFD